MTGDLPAEASPGLVAYLDLDARLHACRGGTEASGEAALLAEMEAMWSSVLSREERDWLEYRGLRQAAAKQAGANVARKLAAFWPNALQQERARAALSDYGPPDAEVERVQLAILKLCDGRAERIAELVEAAKAHRRDLLFRAEHPREAAADWARGRSLSPLDELRLADLRGDDLREYWEWLRG